MSSLSLERLLLLMECPICFEKLDGLNRMLPCQHTFCKRCLEQIIEKSGKLRCPECRTLHTESMNDLQPNILVMKILEYIEQSEKDAQKTSAGEKQAPSPFLFKFRGITTASESQERKTKILVEPKLGTLQELEMHLNLAGTQKVPPPENRSSANPQISSLASAQIGNPSDHFHGQYIGKLLPSSTREQKPNNDNIGSNVTSSGHRSSPFCFKACSLNTPKTNVGNNASKVSIRRAHLKVSIRRANLFPVKLANGSQGETVASSSQKDGTLVRTLQLGENALASNMVSRLSNGTSLTIGENVFTPIAFAGLPPSLSIGGTVFTPLKLSSGLSKGLLSGELKLTPLETNKIASPPSALSKLSSDGLRMAILTDKNNVLQSSTLNCAALSSNGSLNIVKDKNIFTFQAVAQPKTSATLGSGSNKPGPSQNNLGVAQTVAKSLILQPPSNAQGSITSGARDATLFDPKSYCFNVKLK